MHFQADLTVRNGSRGTFPSRVNFPEPVCTVSPGHWGRHSRGLAGATRLTRSDFRLNLLLLKGQRCLIEIILTQKWLSALGVFIMIADTL